MKPYYEDSHVTIYHGDCRDVLPIIYTLDSPVTVVTDPPYGIDGAKGLGGKRKSWRVYRRL